MTKNELLQVLESWETLTLIKSHVAEHSSYLPVLMDIALNGSNRQSWRAAWVADKINELHPGIAGPWIEPLTAALKDLRHPGKKRQYLKLVSEYPISDANRAFLLDYCLEALDSVKEPPSVKAHAMQILYNISEQESGFKEELLQILEFMLEVNESPGIRARAQRLAARLAKEVRARQ
jgi:hypothetical protein